VTRVTPPRPVDVAEILPGLAALARPAVRLHPHPGSPSPFESSVGGPLFWPDSETWPHCDVPHESGGLDPATSLRDVRLRRRIKAVILSRPRDSQYRLPYTPEEVEALKRIAAGCSWPEGPIAMLPVAQLYLRDFPQLSSLGQFDVLQVLWCPFDHGDEHPYPRTELFWRSTEDVSRIITSPPEPEAVQYDWYVPEPCLLDPEQITEYPSYLDLSDDWREVVRRWDTWQGAGASLDSSYEAAPEEFYSKELSTSPGWKICGWPQWGRTDRVVLFCPVCGTRMVPLLTIAPTEWDGETSDWIPYEDQAHTEPSASCLNPRSPAMIRIGDNDSLQIYTCPASPDHPHAVLQQ
jgi:hypothetical protein